MKKYYFDSINKNIWIDIKLPKNSFFSKLRFLFFIFLFFSSLIATYGQCNVVKNGTFTGNANNWTTQPLLTGWHYSAFFPDEIYIEADGINNVSLKQSLVGLIVDSSTNSLTVSFKIKGQNAGRLNCNTTGEISLKIGTLTYMTIKNIANNTQIFSTDITVANGATLLSTPGFPLTVGRTSTGPAITLTQGTINLRIPWTSGMPNADLEFLASSSNTTYSTACGAGGGDDWILDDISVVPSGPTAFKMTGSNVCQGSAATIGLDGSQVGVSYQLQRGGSNVGTAVLGTGNALSFPNQTLAGIYNIVGFLTVLPTCTRTMGENVTIYAQPTPANAGADQTLCYSTPSYGFILNGNQPTIGTGMWTSPDSSVAFANPTSYNSAADVALGVTGRAIWTITNGGICTSSDEVIIKREVALTANAGTDNCAAPNGNFTVVGTPSGGVWTLVSGSSGVSISTGGNVTGFGSNKIGVFKYTVTNSCGSTSDDVVYANAPVGKPTAITISSGTEPTCQLINGTTTTTYATTATSSTGFNWSLSNASAGTINATTGVMTWANGFFGTVDIIVTANGCNGPSAQTRRTVTVSLKSAITNITTTSCSGSAFTVSPVNGTNGVVPSGTTYSWSAPSVTGITGTASGINASSISGNLTNNTNAAINVVYTVTPTSGSCSGSAFTVTVTVNPKSAITNITTTSCSGNAFTVSPINGTNGVVLSGTTYSWSAPSVTGITGTVTGTNASTINGNLTNNTNSTINVVYTVTPTSGSCSGSAFNVTVMVRPTAAASISGTTTVCQSGTSPNITFTNPINLPITVTYNINGGTASTVNVGANTTATVLVPTGTSGTFIYNLVSAVYQGTPTCSASLTASATITVNNVATPTAVVKDQPNCSVLTGSVDLSNLPATGTWTVNVSPVTSNLTGLAGTDSDKTTITGLTAGTTYTFTVTQGSCTSTASANVAIAAPPVIAKWNGTSWSSTPTITTRVEFNASYSSGSNSNAPANVNACSCYINNNAVVTFNSGHTLNVINEVQVLSGSLTFEDQASLVQHKDVPFQPNFGQITYKRNTTITRYDYTYWSSPVKDRTLKQLSYYTLFDRYFSYDNGWVLSRSGAAIMEAGHGYIIRGPQNSSITIPALFEGIFTGEFHNGVYNGNDLAVVPNIDYLLGNPYPSAIDADKFIDANATRLQGTLYFWTHNTEPIAASGTTTYKYTASDYASYNRTGGVGTAGIGTEAVSGGKIPTGKIAAGQGFFARAIGTGNVLFNNSMRLATTPTTYLDNTQFFKLSSNAKTTVNDASTTEKSRVWLNLTNTEGAFKQLLVGYITGATNEYDNGFDGVTYNGNQYVDFYSVNEDKNLVIQGRALPFVKKDSVALGYNTTIKGDFQISIDQVDGIFTTQNVLLEDKELKVQHDLKKEAYTFSTEKGTFNNRFVLRYVDKNAPDEIIIPEIPVALNKGLIVSVQDKKIKISSTLAPLDVVIVYDVAGRKLCQKNKLNTNELIVSNLLRNYQVLIVDVVLTDGTKHSRKIIN